MRRRPQLLFVIPLLVALGTLTGCWGPLTNAAREGNTQHVRTLLDQGHKDVNGMALLQASCNGRTETVQLLLERGGNPSTVSHDGAYALGKSALQCAAMNGH